MLEGMRALTLLLAGILPLAAAEDDPTEVLLRLRDQLQAHAERIPNHTCVETVQRDRFEAAASPAPKSCDDVLARRRQSNYPETLRHATTDRLRLDVALSESHEIYSWAGAARFEEGDIDQLIPDGAIGTGLFATMLMSIFRGRTPKFLYAGETTLDHRLVMEFSFTVPREESHYQVKAGTEWIITGYTGTFWVDPSSGELVRLAFHTDELPPATNTCQTDTTLDYAMVQLGKGDYLLPKRTQQRFIGREGSESENLISFAACREYRGESTLTFGDRRVEIADAAGGAAAANRLPAGLRLTVDLTSTVHGDRAAAGDVVEGRLAKDVVDKAGNVVAPQGAVVQGRLMRVEVRHGRSADTMVALRWEAMERNGVRMPLSLGPQRKTVDLKIGDPGRLGKRGVEIELPLAADSQYGVYHFPGEHAVVESGFRTEWTTTGR
jgi:hypothetical protein